MDSGTRALRREQQTHLLPTVEWALGQMKLRGIYAPLTTPFDHRGRIYWSKFDHNLSQLRRTTLSGFAVAGPWGEGPLLSESEKASLWKRAVAQVEGNASVLAWIADCGVATARDLIAAAAEAGCAAAVIAAPDTEALAPGIASAELFFQSVADKSAIPLLANIDALASLWIDPDALARLSSHPEISGAVVAHCSADYIEKAATACGGQFQLIVRDLESVVSCLASGASAAILPIASAVPFHALSIEEAIRTRELDAARELVMRALDFEHLLESHGVPALKRALDERSHFGGRPRLPLLDVNPGTAEAISRSLYELAS